MSTAIYYVTGAQSRSIPTSHHRNLNKTTKWVTHIHSHCYGYHALHSDGDATKTRFITTAANGYDDTVQADSLGGIQ